MGCWYIIPSMLVMNITFSIFFKKSMDEEDGRIALLGFIVAFFLGATVAGFIHDFIGI